MNSPLASIETPDPSTSSASIFVYVWPAVRYVVAAVGIAALGIALGSWVFAPLALLALVQAIRITLTARRALADHRTFGSFGDEAAALVAAGRYRDVLERAQHVAREAHTKEFRAWGIEWAGYAAIRLDDRAAMSNLLSAALRPPVPPHVPGQLHAALGDYESAVPFFEASLLERRDEEAVIAFVHALAASGDVARAGEIIEAAHDAKPTPALTEWLVWGKLEQDLVDDAFGLARTLAVADVSPWGRSVCQVAALRAADYENSLAWGEGALEGDPHPIIKSVVVYNRACAFARLGQLDRSLQELERVEDAELIRGAPEDDDLEPLWQLEMFRGIVAAAS